MQSKRATVLLIAAVTSVGLVVAPQAGAYTFGWSVCANPTPSGTCSTSVPEASAFAQNDWSADADVSERCRHHEFADQPVRAFRFQNGLGSWRVQMTLSNGHASRRLIGPDLLSARREFDSTQPPAEHRPAGCFDLSEDAEDIEPDGDVVLPSHHSSDPSTFNNLEYLDSPYLVSNGSGGGTVYGILHNEYWGWLFPNQCNHTPANNNTCWYSTITQANSNGSELDPAPVNALGAWYEHPQTSQLIASIPYPYENDGWGRQGYLAPTNVIKWGGYHYMLSTISSPVLDGSVQKAGVCVLRTADLSNPQSWRAWGGSPPGWQVQLVDPYGPSVNPADHVCTPVSGRTLKTLFARSITWNTYLKKFMLIGTDGGASDKLVKYSLSDDLVNWSHLQPLVDPDASQQPTECDEAGAGYPALLDHQDPAANATGETSGVNGEPPVTPNFDHPGRRPHLYFTRFNQVPTNEPPDLQCKTGGDNSDRDLARIPLQLEQRRATLLNGLIDPEYGFDSVSGSYISAVPGTGYDGMSDKYAQALTWIDNGTRWAYGRVDVNWGNGDDVWYGSAFWLPLDFKTVNDSVDLMRWESGSQYGGIRLRQNDTFRLLRSAGSGSTPLGPAEGFDLPLGRWTWVEVHQTLGSSAGAGTFSEVFVDGRLVMSSTEANRESANPITRVKYGFVHNSSGAGLSSMSFDRSSVMAGQLGALGAPATPQGLRTTATGSTATISWNEVAGLTAEHGGYRVYRQTQTGVDAYSEWQPIGWDDDPETATTPQSISGVTSVTDNSLACGTGSIYRYRVTAFDVFPDPEESVVSAPERQDAPSC